MDMPFDSWPDVRDILMIKLMSLKENENRCTGPSHNLTSKLFLLNFNSHAWQMFENLAFELK